MSSSAQPAPIVVELPALGPHVSILRSIATQLTSTLNYPIDELDEVKIATGEAAQLIREHSPEGSTLRSEFYLYDDAIKVVLSVRGATELDQDSFAWTILEALTDELSSVPGDTHVLTFVKRSSLGEEGA